MKKAVFLALFLYASFGFGTFSGTTSEIKNKEQVIKSIKMGEKTLTRVGTGIRSKRVVFNFSVYRATLVVSHPEKFVANELENRALDSLKDMDAAALVLEFKREVPGKDIAQSFAEALKLNGVPDSMPINEFKNFIATGGSIVVGQRVIIGAEKGKGITIVNGPFNKVIPGDDIFIKAIFSIWLGKTADTGLKNLRKLLITSK